MKKFILLTAFQLFVVSSVFSQNVSKPNIVEYTQDSQWLSVRYLNVGPPLGNLIYWSYQDPKHKQTAQMSELDKLDISHFIVFFTPSIESSIKLVDKIIFMLGMEETGKDQDINETFTEIAPPGMELSLNRKAINQKNIYVINKQNGEFRGGLMVDLDLANKLKSAFEIEKRKGNK